MNNAMNEAINEEVLEEFKKKVQIWLKLDNDVKRLNDALKERRKKKNKLNEEIMEFMDKYHFDDLNTDKGIIKYKKSSVKTPLSQKIIKEKLNELFENDDNTKEKINDIFDNREKIEKNKLTFKKLK
jgi:predicted  nucleic acid-binding Zn-ribbon protein